FRLGFNKTWRSRWFSGRDYQKLLHEDLALRQDLKKRFSHAGVSRRRRALYEAVLSRGLEPILSMVAASSTATPTGEPGDFVEDLVEYLAAHSHLPRLIQRAALEDRRQLPASVAKILRPLY